MSIWTHVAGIIRIDKFKTMNPITISRIKSIFEWCLPTGSEGPIQISVVEHTHLSESDIRWCSVLIYGDLRDFDYFELGQIIAWLQGIAKQLTDVHVVVRQGIINVEVETGESVMLQHITEPDKVEGLKHAWKLIE